jgi:hypothetical protein
MHAKYTKHLGLMKLLFLKIINFFLYFEIIFWAVLGFDLGPMLARQVRPLAPYFSTFLHKLSFR